ncbi:hypothetical protein AMELA_G00150580 [Ameiurus melas]|uniref:Uncharacterized protein n=1 Tax=Ameiurus melas TaxID=219545 RepID=A0A7J6AI18_AMEME|nr:hypothetical protein AMELA_G00150580 [Ameiurus melas]
MCKKPSAPFRFAHAFPLHLHLPDQNMASGHPIDSFAFMYRPESSQNSKSKVRPSSSMNPVYSPVQPGTAYANQKTMTYPGNNDGVMQPDTKWSYCYDSNVDYFPITSKSRSGLFLYLIPQQFANTTRCYPAGYPTTAPAYTPNIYQTGTPGYPQGYTTGTPYKVPPAQTNGAPPPYSASPNPYSTAMYPIRSAYPQQNLYAQGAYYSQPVFAQPHRSNGHAEWLHHGHVRRASAHHTTAHATHRHSPGHRANVQAAGVQLRTSALVELPAHCISGVHIVHISSLRGRSLQHRATESFCEYKY